MKKKTAASRPAKASSSQGPVKPPVGRLAELQSKNKRKIIAETGAATRMRGHAKASVQRSQAKRDGRN